MSEHDSYEPKPVAARIGAALYWICFVLALFGVVSALMWIAAGEPEERWEAAGGYAVFAVAVFVLGRILRRALEKRPGRNQSS